MIAVYICRLLLFSVRLLSVVSEFLRIQLRFLVTLSPALSREGRGWDEGIKKRNDARTELTTSHRRSMACGGRNDDAKSMTHPTDGTCGIK